LQFSGHSWYPHKNMVVQATTVGARDLAVGIMGFVAVNDESAREELRNVRLNVSFQNYFLKAFCLRNEVLK